MKKIIITEKQEKELKRRVNEEVYQMPVDKKANKPYSIDPDKVKIVKKFLDKGFKKGNFENIGADGMPCSMKIVAMVNKNGDVLKNMYLDQLQDLLIDRFQNMFLDKTERELFMKQVMNDWFDNKISMHGLLSVNHL